MEVHFTTEQEAQLAHIATSSGTDPEHLVKDAALRLLQEETRFRAAVQGGIAQADRGEFIEEENGRPFRRPFRRDVALLNAYPLDARRRSGLAEHKRLPQRAPSPLSATHHAEALRDDPLLKQWPGRGRPGREQGTRAILFQPLP